MSNNLLELYSRAEIESIIKNFSSVDITNPKICRVIKEFSEDGDPYKLGDILYIINYQNYEMLQAIILNRRMSQHNDFLEIYDTDYEVYKRFNGRCWWLRPKLLENMEIIGNSKFLYKKE